MVTAADTGPERPASTSGGAPDGPSTGEAVARRRLGWMGLGVTGISFLCGLMAASILGAVYAGARGLDQAESEGDLGFAVVTSAGLWVGFLVLPIVWSLGRGGPARVVGLSVRWVDLPAGLAAGVASTVVTALVSSVLLTKDQQDALEAKAVELVDRAQGPVAVGVLVVMLCVLTPIAEETFFRGMLFGSVRRLMWPVAAVLVAGSAFGPVHYAAGTPGRVLAVELSLLGLFGVVLCALALRTGRLGASIVAHAVFNGITVVSLLVQR